jgi:hypothetical protein
VLAPSAFPPQQKRASWVKLDGSPSPYFRPRRKITRGATRNFQIASADQIAAAGLVKTNTKRAHYEIHGPIQKPKDDEAQNTKLQDLRSALIASHCRSLA